MAGQQDSHTTTKTVIGIKLEGDHIPFDTFIAALTGFQHFISAIHADIGVQKRLTWRMADLSMGSAQACIQPEEEDLASIEETERVNTTTAQAIAIARTKGIGAIPHSPKVINSYLEMVGATGSRPVELQLIYGGKAEPIPRESVWSADAPAAQEPTAPPRVSYGVIRGKVEGRNIHKGERFTLYEDIHERPIECTVPVEWEHFNMETIWAKRVAVRGFLTPAKGNKTATMDEIEEITPIDPVEGDFASTRGILKIPHSDEEILEDLRRIRRL